MLSHDWCRLASVEGRIRQLSRRRAEAQPASIQEGKNSKSAKEMKETPSALYASEESIFQPILLWWWLTTLNMLKKKERKKVGIKKKNKKPQVGFEPSQEQKENHP